MSYVQPDEKNSRKRFGKSPTVPRDAAPHGITLATAATPRKAGTNIIPQTWTIEMTSDTGDYKLTGTQTGPDGEGNAFKPFTSTTGQITIDPAHWRRAERNHTGDRFTFEVKRATVNLVNFHGKPDTEFTIRLGHGGIVVASLREANAG